MRSLAAVAVLALTAQTAAAHDLRGYVSASGIEFIERQVPSYVPSRVNAPRIEKSFACMDAVQYNTVVDIDVQNLDISLPETDVLRVDLTLGVHATGNLDIDDPYVCAGFAACKDRLDLDSGRAIIDFAMSIEGGMPRVSLRNLELLISEEDIDVTISDCAIDGVANTMIGFAREWLLGYLLNKAEEMAEMNVGPMLEGMLAGFMRQELKLGSADVGVALEELSIDPSGLQLAIDVDAYNDLDPAECIGGADPGEPARHEGTPPNFSASMGAHLGLAVNFGLIDDVFYHVWRRGLTCLTGDHLEALGLHIDYEHISAMLPGFPAGTEFGLDIKLARPPRIVGRASSDASVGVVIEGLEVKIIGTLPDGSERAVGMSMDLEAAATVAVDPTTNALVLRMDSAEMKSMRFDQQGAAQLGFDPAQLRTVMNTMLVPTMLRKMGDMPMTGSMFAFGEYAIILRNLDTASEAYLTAEVDLFRAPADDTGVPDTAILESPAGLVSPATARVRVGGTDPEIPSELLRYEVVIDGVAQPLSPITAFAVGEAGVTRTYRVEVAAVDLSGNTDATPATLELTVDGIAPKVLIIGDRSKDQPEGGLVPLTWSSTDDTTPESALSTTLKVYRIVDPQDALSAELIEEIPLPVGATSAEVNVAQGNLYRVEVEVTDQAGNTSSSALLLDAGTGGCLCNAGGNPGDAVPMALAFFGLLLIGGRRRRA